MSPEMVDGCSPSHPTPVLHIHGTGDGINPYAGTSTMVGIEEMVRYRVDQNDGDTTPVVTQIPDVGPADGATAERYLYTGGTGGNTVELFKVTGGEHSWPGSPMPSSNEVTCMDFDARKEIWRFFIQYPGGTAAIPENAASSVVPNPAREFAAIEAPGHSITQTTIYDAGGRIVQQFDTEGSATIDASRLDAGNYLLRISGDDLLVMKRLVISRR